MEDEIRLGQKNPMEALRIKKKALDIILIILSTVLSIIAIETIFK